ncbi:lipopolysaccharide biosynthesis protein [Thalassorhabdomicrobium marinisediminis]|uniref:lipopolysaccharide biosynthesis protein n=1 Tax=Thalassorhabdomicrobium marinisediminis TaxID=2170577 RepID=UPI00248FD520|nr:hypothetical protein [Thalassorhabdomicrobium marinisediminis]
MVLEANIAKRLIKGSGANLAGKVWALATQLLAVPVMTHFWGVDGFGVWLMISTIPTYLALSDFGLGVAASVVMTSAMERGDKETAQKAFQSVWAFLTAGTTIIGALSIVIAWIWLTFTQQAAAGPFPVSEVFLAICLTVIAALFSLQMSIRKIVFNATHKYALGTALLDGLYFANMLCMLMAIALGAGLVGATTVFLIGRLFCLTVYIALQRHYEPWCKGGLTAASSATLKPLLNPSMGALALTMANSFGLQGVVLTIGWTFGPAAAAVFATTRLLTRIPLQFSGLLVRASLPELTRAQISGKTDLTARLMHINTLSAMAIMIPATIGLVAIGPSVLTYMSDGEMTNDRLSFALLGIAALFSALWTTMGTRLIAVNRQSEFAYLALGLYGATALVPVMGSDDLLYVLMAIALADGMIALRIWRARE